MDELKMVTTIYRYMPISENIDFSNTRSVEASKTVYGVRVFGKRSEIDSVPREIILLAQNQRGLKNICKILSSSNNKELTNTEYMGVSYENILNNREGIIVGMVCTRSDLYQVWTDDEQDHEGEKTYALVSKEYEIADFVLIQRWKNYTGMMGGLANVLYPEEVTIKWLLSEIVDSLETVNKCAAAADIICKEHALTSKVLMDEYSQPEGYREKRFGTEMARKIVLDGPKAIADMIEE